MPDFQPSHSILHRSFNKTLAVMAVLAMDMASCTQQQPTPATAPAQEYPKDAQAEALYNKAVAFFPDNADSILVYARNAASQAEKTGDWHTWGNAQRYVLTASYMLGNFKKTAETLPALRETAEKLIPGDTDFWADYYHFGGVIYFELGNYEKALEFGRQEIDLYEKTGSDAGKMAVANSNQGIYYIERADFDRALTHINVARHWYTVQGTASPEDWASVYDVLSTIFYRKKDFAAAIDHAEKGLRLIEAPGITAPELAVKLNLDIASPYIELRQYDTALRYLEKALALQRTHNIGKFLPGTMDNLGVAYVMKGLYPKAKVHLQAALEQYGETDPSYMAPCRHMGLMYQRQKDYTTALQWQQKALRSMFDTQDLKDSLSNPALIGVNDYYDLMAVLKEKGESLYQLARQTSQPALMEASLATYDLATVVLDSMRAIYQEGSTLFWNREARPILEKAIDVALHLHQSSGDDRYVAQAFRYSEKGKAYLLAEALNESVARQKAGIPDALLKQEKQFKIDIAFYKNKILTESQKTEPDSAKISLWETEVHLLQSQYERLKKSFETDYPAYFQIKYQQNIPGIAAIQQTLPDDTGLLEYFQGDSATYAFYIDRQQVNAARCASYHQLGDMLSRLSDADAVSEHGRDAAVVQSFVQDATGLYQSLVAPAVPTLPGHLLLIPDGELAFLPFELLLTPDPAAVSATATYDQLPYLLQKTTIQYEYSALLRFQKPVKNHPVRFFDGYAPVYGHDVVAVRGDKGGRRVIRTSNFPSLAHNRQEVEQAAHQTGGNAITGLAATKAYFLEHAAEPRILHLAMHGFVDDSILSYAGLVFSPSAKATQDFTDGILYADEVYGLHLNAELTVLSACNTGRGMLAKGEGVMSLARAFKYAGCPNVLMSLWQADDVATADIMTRFYGYLGHGWGKAAAIRQAKLDYLQQSPRRNHPFYWGAFVLIGDDLPLTATTPWWYWIGGMCLAGAAWMFFKRRA